MTSTSELIARADQVKAECEVRENHPDDYCPDLTAMLRECEANLRTAANQSGSERAGVDALREALEFGIWAVSGPTNEAEVERLEQIIEETWREYQAKATPPAQPAPKGGDEVERLRDAVSLALQYLPAQPSGSDAQKDIARIHDLIAGKAVAWDKAHVSESPSTHGKPLQPGWLKDQLDKAAGRAAAMPSWMTHPGESTHGKPDGAVRQALSALVNVVSNMRVPQNVADAALQVFVIGPVLERAKAALAGTSGDAPQITMADIRAHVGDGMVSSDDVIAAANALLRKHWAAETSPGDVLAMKEACKRAVTELDCMYVNDERVPYGGIPADPESSVWREAIKAAEAAIDRLDVKAEAKSQEPEAVAYRCRSDGEPEWQYGETLLIEDDFFRKERGFEEQPLYAHPTTKPEAPAVSVDAIKAALEPLARIARLLDQDREQPGHDDEVIFKLRGYKAVSITIGDCRKATAIAALIAGGR